MVALTPIASISASPQNACNGSQNDRDSLQGLIHISGGIPRKQDFEPEPRPDLQSDQPVPGILIIEMKQNEGLIDLGKIHSSHFKFR